MKESRLTKNPRKGRNKNVSIWVSNAERFIIQERAALVGLKISPFVRECAMKGQVQARHKIEERQFFRETVDISNALNQLLVMAEEEGMLAVALEFQHYRDRVNGLLKGFNI